MQLQENNNIELPAIQQFWNEISYIICNHHHDTERLFTANVREYIAYINSEKLRHNTCCCLPESTLEEWLTDIRTELANFHERKSSYEFFITKFINLTKGSYLGDFFKESFRKIGASKSFRLVPYRTIKKLILETSKKYPSFASDAIIYVPNKIKNMDKDLFDKLNDISNVNHNLIDLDNQNMLVPAANDDLLIQGLNNNSNMQNDSNSCFINCIKKIFCCDGHENGERN